MLIKPQLIFQAPDKDLPGVNPKSGNTNIPSNSSLQLRRNLAATLLTYEDTRRAKFFGAINGTPLESYLPKVKSPIEKFLKTNPSDKLIQACATDLRNGSREEAILKETLSIYESLSKAKIDDRFIPVFQSLVRANEDNKQYSRPQLVEVVIVPLSRIQNFSDKLLTKATNDLSYLVGKNGQDESKLAEYIKVAQNIAGYKPTADIRNLYNNILNAVCATNAEELRLTADLNRFFKRLSNLSISYDVQTELEKQIQYTGTQFGSVPNSIDKYLLSVITSFINFNDRLTMFSSDRRTQVVAHYNELVQITKDSGMHLDTLNDLFTRGIKDDFITEELDIANSLYRSSLHSTKSGLADLIAYRGESALELKRSLRDLYLKANDKDNAVAKSLISNFNSLALYCPTNWVSDPGSSTLYEVPNLKPLLPIVKCFDALIDSNNFRNNTVHILTERFKDSLDESHYPSDLAYNKFVSAIKAKGYDAAQLKRQLILITAHDILMHNISNTGKVPDWKYFSEIFHNGDLPFRHGTPEYDQCLRESQIIMRASFNAHYGFGALANDAKGWKDSILARFGRDVAFQEVQAPRCKDGNAFPGMGYVITGLNDDFLRIPDPAREMNGDEAYQDFLANYPFLAAVADDISSTQFTFLRGMVVITNTKDKYCLPDRNHQMIPYSLVIYNDHFHNNGYDIAFLVPSKILLDKMKPTLFSIYDTDAPATIPQNINDVPLDIESLRKEAHDMNASILSLGSSSNIAGLSNAWEPNRRPYWAWEAEKNQDWRDLDGHKHKWFAMARHERFWTPENEEEMKPFQRVHKEVYGVAKSLFDNLNSFKLFLSAYKHGYLGNFASKKSSATRDESIRTFASSDSFQTSSDNDMMFDQAYLLRQAALKRKATNFPKLVVYDTYKWSSEPIEGFELDLANMQLTWNGQTHQLNLDKPTATDRSLWRRVFNQFTGLNYDFRFYEKGLNQH